MPLARIITDSVDDSLELTMQLRARGFLVETVSPDQIPSTPADLEVRLEECSPEDVLSKAAEVTENEDLWVFVAPGALDERARPIRTISLLPHVFDVPIPRMIPTKFETSWPVEPMGENRPSQVVAPPTGTPVRMPAEIPLAPGNGGKNEIAADLKKESATVPPVIVPGAPAKPTPDVQPKVKVVVLPKLSEAQQIPEVAERAEPNRGLAPKATNRRVRLRGPYKISFQTGARFWKRIVVSSALAVVAGLLVAVVALRPHLSQSAKPATSAGPAAVGAGVNPTKPPSSSATVKSSTAPVGAPAQGVAPAVPPVAGRATPQVAGPSVPQMAAKPVAESAAAAAAKSPRDIQQNAPAKPAAASPGPNNPNKAQPVRRHTGSPEADIVAEDTVVFYDRKPASSGKRPQESGVKR
jgi:hypothetical protein